MDKMKELFVSGHFKPGDRLPTEQELAESFGIGRSSVREAIKIFQYLGVLETRTSQGTFVCQRGNISAEALSWIVILGQQDMSDMMEIRMLLEEAGFRKLAEKFAREPKSISGEIESLEQAYKKMVNAKSQNDAAARIQSDFDFHSIIIESSENELMVAIFNAMRGFIAEEILKLDSFGNEKSHRNYIDAIKTGNVKAMIEYSSAHMRGILDQIEKSERVPYDN